MSHEQESNMSFKITHLFMDSKPVYVAGDQPPEFLVQRRSNSTASEAWFWNDQVLKLSVGQSIDTDFHKFTRIR